MGGSDNVPGLEHFKNNLGTLEGSTSAGDITAIIAAVFANLLLFPSR